MNTSGETYVKFIFLTSGGTTYFSGLATNYYKVLPFLQGKIKVLSSSWQGSGICKANSTLIPKKIVHSELNRVTIKLLTPTFSLFSNNGS